MGALIDLAGLRFGRLLVLRRDLTSKRLVHWRCRCDCGGTIITAGVRLRTGETASLRMPSYRTCSVFAADPWGEPNGGIQSVETREGALF